MSTETRYKPGQLVVHYHDAKCGWEESGGEDGYSLCDILGDGSRAVPEGVAFLPYRSDDDDYTIGGREELLALRVDIDAALARMDSPMHEPPVGALGMVGALAIISYPGRVKMDRDWIERLTEAVRRQHSHWLIQPDDDVTLIIGSQFLDGATTRLDCRALNVEMGLES